MLANHYTMSRCPTWFLMFDSSQIKNYWKLSKTFCFRECAQHVPTFDKICTLPNSRNWVRIWFYAHKEKSFKFIIIRIFRFLSYGPFLLFLILWTIFDVLLIFMLFYSTFTLQLNPLQECQRKQLIVSSFLPSLVGLSVVFWVKGKIFS